LCFINDQNWRQPMVIRMPSISFAKSHTIRSLVPNDSSHPHTLVLLIRRCAGSFPDHWAVRNKFIQEWNGKREITEKTWELGSGNSLQFLFYIGFLPVRSLFLVLRHRKCRPPIGKRRRRIQCLPLPLTRYAHSSLFLLRPCSIAFIRLRGRN
jgi:hypothetical protein